MRRSNPGPIETGQNLGSDVNIQPEEEDDDLIYECPGLAPHGEMEVTNPFFHANHDKTYKTKWTSWTKW